MTKTMIMESHTELLEDILTTLRMLLFLKMDTLLSQHHGMALFVFGISILELLPDALLVTVKILSVAFSADNRQIVSGSRDKTIRLWNTLGECKYTVDDGHSDWVSCVQFSPNAANPIIVSSGWDRIVKVWTLADEFKLKKNLVGHTGYINAVTVSPDGSLCASGGKDGTAMLWDLNEGKHLYSLDAGGIINTLVFSPNRYWLCAGTDSSIHIWDLESKNLVAKLDKSKEGFSTHLPNPACTSLAWSADGSTLFAGYTDNHIRVWGT